MTKLRCSTAVVAACALISLQAGAICQGWRSTPAERMACCAPEAQCPMETAPGGTDHHDRTTQAQADACCAMSEAGDSGREIAASASSVGAAALLDVGTVAAFQPNVTYGRRPAPRPPTRVHTHVLLSVFLV